MIHHQKQQKKRTTPMSSQQVMQTLATFGVMLPVLHQEEECLTDDLGFKNW